ncbi:thermonuclease family protein [Pseudaminobacter sp. 19-2017]|uniref:Thermonuclease family protein n=2 Tax=Pseudaminobacter soli (ex Zhang et al. 2022) TaxID=2831468 RepID=A0A942EBC1_9HYPH|nr:thermonuclease family protein [Pseudaminobacter soli]MBS3651942.1 thermonuclease family protein [Pseudaminobacter soli]
MNRRTKNVIQFRRKRRPLGIQAWREAKPTRQSPLRRLRSSTRSLLLVAALGAAAVVFPQLDSYWQSTTANGVSVIRPAQTVSTSPSVIVPRSAPEKGAAVTGRASVVDGDTLEIQGERIRLHGIDAPESGQLCEDRRRKSYPCGTRSANYLADVLAKSRPTTCEFVERDAYDRMVATCYRADGANVAALMVSAGHALDWPRYSGGAYVSEQQQAKEKKLGMWRGMFTEPWQWRSEQRAQQVPNSNTPTMLLGAKQRSTTGCQIKGNISDKGERIYHMPGQRYYDRTKIDPAKGERMFCSEGEARAAGWRRSKI